MATNAIQTRPWKKPTTALIASFGRDEPEVREQQIGERLEQGHELERLGLALELAARVVGEVGHGSRVVATLVGQPAGIP